MFQQTANQQSFHLNAHGYRVRQSIVAATLAFDGSHLKAESHFVHMVRDGSTWRWMKNYGRRSTQRKKNDESNSNAVFLTWRQYETAPLTQKVSNGAYRFVRDTLVFQINSWTENSHQGILSVHENILYTMYKSNPFLQTNAGSAAS